jgi:hypothetical protein
MEWTSFSHGEFAKCEHGYYFIYRRFNRELGLHQCFADYHRALNFPGRRERFALQSLESLEEARRRCEQHAQQSPRRGV